MKLKWPLVHLMALLLVNKNLYINLNLCMLGSPTLGGHMPTQVQSALGTIMQDLKAKEMPCGVFGSFGWSGEAVDELNERLTNGGFTFSFDPIKIKFKPTAKVNLILNLN